MDFECKSLSDKALAREKCDGLLLVLGPQGDAGEGVLATLAKRAQSDEVLDSKAGACVLLYRAPEVAAVRTVLAQGGDGSARQVAKAVTAAAVQLKSGKPRKLVLAFAQQPTEDALRAALQALADALYVYTATKSKAEPSTVQRVLVALPEATPLKAAFRQAVATAAGVELAREWANRPANVATPTALASVAQALTELPKVQCEVLGPREVAKLGMGSFQAVAQGTEEELRFIVLRYNGAAKSAAPIVLVGKGITFDSGGISLKPGAEMDEMKFDMSGAASVLGVFRALAELQPKINVVGLIPACENLPSGRAIKPGDVVTTMSGQTVEILNTDAEGRLILCDALTYAERFKPRAVIDIATLTGACMIALGGVRSGMFASQDELAQQLLAAGEATLDLTWRMPLDDDYSEGLKSNFADVANVAGRAGGAITAAKFLQRFAEHFAWAHLDIAGVAWKSGSAKGATGRPVPLLVQYLMQQAAAK